jgi:hypothetical protein
MFSVSEVHIAFSYRGATYVVWEPFGDNSRYWICPEDKPAQPGDVRELERIFQVYTPSLLKRIFRWSFAAALCLPVILFMASKLKDHIRW